MSKAYVLCTKHHGNNKQLGALASYYPGVDGLILVDCDLRSRSPFFRPFYRVLSGFKKYFKVKGRLAVFLNNLVLKNADIEIKDEDIVFAKTKPYEFPLAILLSGTQAESIFIGETRNKILDDKTKIISTPSTPAEKADFFLETLPSDMVYTSYLKRKKELSVCETIWGVFLGGNTRSYNYNIDNTRQLLVHLAEMAEKKYAKLLIVSSPRTGCKIEEMIDHFFKEKKAILDQLILWKRGDKTPMIDLFAKSELVFVSEDSVSMLSEAINTRLPVFSIRPENEVEYNSLVTPFVSHHAGYKRVKRISFSDLSSLDVDKWVDEEFKPVQSCWAESLSKQISC